MVRARVVSLAMPQLIGGEADQGLFWFVKVSVPVEGVPNERVEETYMLHNNWIVENGGLKVGDEIEFDACQPVFTNSPHGGMTNLRRTAAVPEVQSSVG